MPATDTTVHPSTGGGGGGPAVPPAQRQVERVVDGPLLVLAMQAYHPDAEGTEVAFPRHPIIPRTYSCPATMGPDLVVSSVGGHLS